MKIQFNANLNTSVHSLDMHSILQNCQYVNSYHHYPGTYILGFPNRVAIILEDID